LGTGIFDQISHVGYRLGITKSFDYFLDFYLNAEISSAHLPINSDDPVSEHLNSIYSVLSKENERKLFDNHSFKLSTSKEWKVGLHTFLAIEYVWKRDSLGNNFTHAWVKGGDFSSHYPYFESKIHENFAKLQLQISYSPGQLYERLGKERYLQNNIYPTFTLNYKAGLGNATSLSYHFLQFNTNYQLPTKYVGTFSFMLGGGIFADRARINFIDFKHFNTSLYHFHVRDAAPLFQGQPVIKQHSAVGYFLTLEPWTLSTDQSYAEFHVEQDLLGMLWNRIPGIRKINLKWLWGAKVLSTAPYNAIFVEYYIGFYNILKFIRIDLASHYYQGKFILPQVRLKLKITN
jgi:hypothetical protein